MKKKAFYEFGAFRLDEEQRILRCGPDRVDLTPKAFSMLLFLVQHCGNLVSKQELMRSVWPDTNVDEANLAVTIGMLRKALRNSDGDRDYIETVPKLGYRFNVPVNVPAAECREDENPTEPGKNGIPLLTGSP